MFECKHSFFNGIEGQVSSKEEEKWTQAVQGQRRRGKGKTCLGSDAVLSSRQSATALVCGPLPSL